MDLKSAEKSVEAGAEALVQDVVTTLRNHPQYAGLVNTLVEKTVLALAEGL
jgi:hypothetical protein